MAVQNASNERGIQLELTAERQAPLIVTQPKKLEGLLEVLSLIDKVSETIGEGRSGDWSGSSGGAGTQQDDSQTQQSLRELAIANLPEPPVMRLEIAKHIENEVHKLSKQVHRAAKKAGKPGSAYKLNNLYARIRRLNGLLSEILETSFEVVKRLYIRIFVDKQTIA